MRSGQWENGREERDILAAIEQSINARRALSASKVVTIEKFARTACPAKHSGQRGTDGD